MLTNDFAPGAPNWIDLGTRDTEAAAAYYKALFGWDFMSAGPEAGGYGMFQLEGRTVAAMGPLQGTEAKPSWTLYFESADADATTRAVEQAGGSVSVPPMDIFDQGRMARYTDPSGAEFAIWQPRSNRGLDRVGAGALCWTELYTTDAGSAKRFYKAVLDWDYQDMPLPNGNGTYVVVSRAGGGQDGSHGGIMKIAADMLPGGESYWQPYFAVADCDGVAAKAKERGGSILMPPADMEGVGRMALLKDAEGAYFALLTPSPSMA